MAIQVAYWSIRGLGAPLRMMCEHVGVEYESVHYDCLSKDDGGWDTSSWFNVKPAVQAKNPLANLPYVEIDNVVVTQSNACMTKLGGKLDLLGATDAEKAEVEQLLCEVMDLRNACIAVFYGGDLEGLSGLAKHGSLRKLNAWLAQKGTAFLVGASPTAPDFHLWELLDQLKILASTNGEKEKGCMESRVGEAQCCCIELSFLARLTNSFRFFFCIFFFSFSNKYRFMYYYFFVSNSISKQSQQVLPRGKVKATASSQPSTRRSTLCRSWPLTRRPPCTRSRSTTRWRSSAAPRTASACGTTPSPRCAQLLVCMHRGSTYSFCIVTWHACSYVMPYISPNACASTSPHLCPNVCFNFLYVPTFVMSSRIDFRPQQQAPPREAPEGRVGPRQGAHGAY